MVSSRELSTALPYATRSAITFALTRLERDNTIERVARGKYRAPATETDENAEAEDEAYLNALFETVRPHLRFQDLALLFELVNSTRRLLPETFRGARRKTQAGEPRA